MRPALLALLLLGCNVRPYAHFTPLIDAARDGDVATVRALLSRGADPNEPAGNNNWTPLLHAVHKHQVGSVAALLDGGADINRASPDETTPLMMAAGYGDTAIVKLLLQRGASPRIADSGGFHAIDIAAAGVPDIDEFTLFRCQDDTVRVLRDADPTIAMNSRVAAWARTKRCRI